MVEGEKVQGKDALNLTPVPLDAINHAAWCRQSKMSTSVTQCIVQGHCSLSLYLPNSLSACIHSQLTRWWARSYYVLGTRTQENVLETCSLYTSVHITSTVKCSRFPFIQILIGTHVGLRNMTYFVYCAMCRSLLNDWQAADEVILTRALRADSGLRAKPRPVRICSRFHSVQTSFQRRTKGAICSKNMVRPRSSWNCSSRNTTL